MINGKLSKISVIEIGKNGGEIWLCRCSCGEEISLTPPQFRKQKSCGCSKRPNLVNRKFGKLTVKNGSHVCNGRYYWMCECDCGNSVPVCTAQLKNGHTTSCGCFKIEKLQEKHLPNGVALMNRVIENYYSNARVKNLKCELSREDFIELFKGNCFYCGIAPSTTTTHKKLYGQFTYNGIDRTNNSVGYIIGNVVSCCAKCNYKKGSDNSDDFISWIKKISDNLYGEKNR